MPCYPYNRGGNYGDYYRGDYYQGDYYRGDPFFHKKLLKGALKLGTAIVKATPIGRAISTGYQIGQSLLGRERPSAFAPPPPPMLPPGQQYPVGPPAPGQSFPIGPPFGMNGGACYSGYRWNKSGYYTAAGYVAPRSKCVRVRRMNVANVRALRRAIRRAQGFTKIARRLVRIQATFKKGGGKKRKK